MQTLVRRGQVWKAWIPFEDEKPADEKQGKSRPVLILGWTSFAPDHDRNLMILPVWSFGGDAQKAQVNDVRVSDPVAAGLKEGSFIRCGRISHVSPNALDLGTGLLGAVPNADLDAALTEVAKLFTVNAFALLP